MLQSSSVAQVRTVHGMLLIGIGKKTLRLALGGLQTERSDILLKAFSPSGRRMDYGLPLEGSMRGVHAFMLDLARHRKGRNFGLGMHYTFHCHA